MRYNPIAKHAVRAALVVLVSLYVAVPAAQAQEVKGSHVEVLICPRGSQSSLHVQRPVSDSIVTSPTVQVSGTVQSISQIDFFIDDVYNNSLAIGLGETVFSSEIALSPGTHTIRLTAIDSCAQETRSDSTVVTYHPQLETGAGRDTDTALPGAAGAGNASTSGSGGGAAAATGQSPADGGGHVPLPPFVHRLLDKLDITPGAAGAPGLPTAVQSLSALAGVLLLALSPFLLHTTVLRSLVGRLHGIHHTQLIVQLIGALLVIVPFVA